MKKKLCKNVTIYFISYFLSSEVMETVLATFVAKVFVTFVGILFVMFITSLHIITDQQYFLNTYHFYNYMC